MPRAGIDQEAVSGSRWLPVVVLVVKDSRVLVQRDDVRVRYVCLRLAGRLEVSQMNLELAGASVECFAGRLVPAGGLSRRLAHAGKLPSGLVGALVMNTVHKLGGVGLGHRKVPRHVLADEGYPVELLRPRHGGVHEGVRVGEDLDGHERVQVVGRIRRLMPVVVGLVKEELRRPVCSDQHQAPLAVVVAQPLCEMRIRPERRGLVVEEIGPGAAGGDERAIECRTGKGVRPAPRELANVLGEQRIVRAYFRGAHGGRKYT